MIKRVIITPATGDTGIGIALMKALFIDLCFDGGFHGEVVCNGEKCIVDCNGETACTELDKILYNDELDDTTEVHFKADMITITEL